MSVCLHSLHLILFQVHVRGKMNRPKTRPPSGLFVDLTSCVYGTDVCYLPRLLRQRQSDASPVFELRWVVDAGSCKLRAAGHAGQTGLR